MARTPLLTSLLAVLLCGCAVSDPFAPSSVPPVGMPYGGLNDASYGPRTVSQFRACDGQDESSRLGRIGAMATRPTQGLMKIDSTVQSLGLASSFTDPTGQTVPPVAVIDHAPDGIVFWHSLRSVPLSEVASAARAYCGGLKRGVLYRGSASRCPAPQRGLTGAPVVETHVISAYACTARP